MKNATQQLDTAIRHIDQLFRQIETQLDYISTCTSDINITKAMATHQKMEIQLRAIREGMNIARPGFSNKVWEACIKKAQARTERRANKAS